jgi:hypothetical protein
MLPPWYKNNDGNPAGIITLAGIMNKKLSLCRFGRKELNTKASKVHQGEKDNSR